MFLASSDQSLIEAYNAIDSFNENQKIIFMANIFEHGLMNASFPTNLMIGFVKKHRKRVGLEHMFNILVHRSGKLVDSLIAETKNHMLHGYDTEDKNSAGGFSQREINLLFKNVL